MKNFCKKVWFLGLLCVLCGCFFTSCSETVSADDERILPPDTSRSIDYRLYPNDMAKNDSAAANLARGIALYLHPGASYTLSFDIDPSQPIPELQLFRTYNIKGVEGRLGFTKVRSLLPTVIGNRYVYSFICGENKMSVWFTSLGVNGEYYKGTVNNISLTGIGTNSDHFSINLIVVGAMENTLDGMNTNELANYMLKLFREKYYGVTIDTLYVRYAHNHPTLGSLYPANQPWVAGMSSEDVFVSDLADWPEKELQSSLNIMLVHSIGTNDIMGFSHLFAGVLGSGRENSVVIGTHVRKSPSEYELLSSNSIALTAIHETGHAFGLRHTSTTRRDLNLSNLSGFVPSDISGDLSNIEDGLTDTPFCEYILNSGLYKQAAEDAFDSRGASAREGVASRVKASIYTCPDLDNIMFPVTVDGYENATFTAQQMELIRSTLMIIPH